MEHLLRHVVNTRLVVVVGMVVIMSLEAKCELG